jgi:methionyl aminopeptidase
MIPIKSKEEIEIMKKGGKILAEIMKELENNVSPGIATKELDRLAESLIFKYGATSSFKGYKDPREKYDKPYPAALCTSVNEEIVHAVPSDRILKEGDILSLDLGIFYKGFHTDMAITVPVGKVELEILRLIKVTKKALKRGIAEIKPGKFIGDIENAIGEYVESQGFNVIRELCGHGIGKELHEEPQILNFGDRGTGQKIKEGMVFCLEPMVSVGKWRIKKSKDGFGYETVDGSWVAHFEHTIAVTKNGAEVLTSL